MSLSSAEKVANGAQMLDEKQPGWYRLIDLSTLRISDGCSCICGQLGRLEGLMWAQKSRQLGFGETTFAMVDGPEWADFVHDHGFVSGVRTTDEWKLAIQARLDADAVAPPAPVEEKEEVFA